MKSNGDDEYNYKIEVLNLPIEPNVDGPYFLGCNPEVDKLSLKDTMLNMLKNEARAMVRHIFVKGDDIRSGAALSDTFHMMEFVCDIKRKDYRRRCRVVVQHIIKNLLIYGGESIYLRNQARGLVIKLYENREQDLGMALQIDLDMVDEMIGGMLNPPLPEDPK